MSKNFHALAAILTLSSFMVAANTKNDHHVPLQHCYHWLNEVSLKYLTYKYNFASKHDGEMTFYTDPAHSNGAIAGPGLYCGKTPGDSYGYGERVVRVDLVDDVVMLDSLTGTQYCGHKGDYYKDQSECQKKPWDIKFYSGGGRGQMAWYVIRNPQAVFSWSANSEQLVTDLNAEKSFESSAYSTHADATIRLIRNDKGLNGSTLVVNNNARLSIIKILKDPAKLAQIPPLTVLALVHSYKGDELTSAQKKNIYLSQFERAFKDTQLTFADMMSAVKLGQEMETAFLVELRKIPMNQLDKVNPVLVLQGLDRYESAANLSDAKVKVLWQASLLSDNDLQSLVDTSLTDKGVFASSLETSLPAIDVLKSKATSSNLVPIIKILNKYVASGTGALVKASFRMLLKEMIQKKGMAFAKTYDNLDNALLDKETVLASIVLNDLMAPAVIKEANPIFLGLALDRVVSKINPDNLKNVQNKILKLPLLVDSVPSYQILDDLENKKFILPSFYPEQEFMVKLISRSIGEQKISKTPSNTFRMVMSGFFSFYNEPVRSAKNDNDKATASQKASDSFMKLATLMTTKELIPYRYITLQNASFFLGKGRAKDHPIEHELALYKQGDASFDKFIEESVVTSYDGSLIQYLLFQSRDPNLVSLLKMSVDHLLSKEFSQILANENFISSQNEKKAWSNIINNKNYSPTSNSKVPSTVCHTVTVFKRYHKEVARSLSTTDANDMIEWVKNMESGFCKVIK